MFKKILVSLVILSVVICGVTVLQSMGGKPEPQRSEDGGQMSEVKGLEFKRKNTEKPKIKFTGVDAKDLKVAKVERLTYDAHKTEYKSYMYPKWSPDGKMIAFTMTNSFEGAEWVEKLKYKGFWVMNADGRNKRKLTDEEDIGYNFEWTSDSESIVYKVGKTIKEIEMETKKSYMGTSAKKSISSLIKHPSGEIITVVDDEVIQIVKDEDTRKLKTYSIKTSKKKEKIVYSLNSKVWSADADGENKIILGKGKNAILSPCGKMICRISYEKGSRIEHGIVTIDEGYKIFLGGIPYTPSWAPDGSKIVFADVRVEEQTGIYPESHRVKFVTGGIMWADLYIYDVYKVGSKGWENLTNIEEDFFVYKSGSESRKNLTNTPNEAELSPDWSPDGSKIVYVSGKSGDIYILTLEIK